MPTVREFRANLKDYLQRMKEGEIIEVAGVELCVYTPPKDEPKAVYTPTHSCEKCKASSECRKIYEEGVEHLICIACALKARLAWHRLEKLPTE